MNINQYYQVLRERFSRETIALPGLDARLFLKAVTGFSDADFITKGESPLTPQQIETLEQFAARRLEGEPVSRILGLREFWGLEFKVTSATLDPRADSEILVERALHYTRRLMAEKTGDGPLVIADIGTGTGCLLISLLTELPDARGIAVDISPAALSVARENAGKHGVLDRIEFRESDYLDALEPQSVDVLISNPPYIRESDIPSLAKDVRNYDPMLALSGGADGLEAYKKLLEGLQKTLCCGGYALFEIGHDQAEDLARLTDDSKATLFGIAHDLGGRPRVVEIACGVNEKKL